MDRVSLLEALHIREDNEKSLRFEVRENGASWTLTGRGFPALQNASRSWGARLVIDRVYGGLEGPGVRLLVPDQSFARDLMQWQFAHRHANAVSFVLPST